MNNTYNNLCVFNFGKHVYVVMKNADKVMYFENVDGKYAMPITNFNLYDNQGKSLTLVNQHFFMNQLISRLNVAFKKGYFSNDDDVIKYLNDLKGNSENNVELMKLFKGAFMSEINESNFEHNKREILKFLDKYRFDTFVNYNNVAIFNGSLDKGNAQVNVEPVAPVAEVPIQNFDFSGQGFPPIDESPSQAIEQPTVQPVVEEPIEQQVTDVVSEQPVVENVQPSDEVTQVAEPVNPMEQVMVDAPVFEQAETPVIEQPVVEEISTDVVEQPVIEENTVAQPIIEDQPVIAEQPVIENVQPIVEQPIEQSVEQPIVEQPVDNTQNQDSSDDMFNFNKVANESSNFIDSNDYFSSLGGVSQETVLQGPVVAGVSSNDYFSQFTDSSSQSSIVSEPVNNQQENLSYIDEVKNRMDSSNINQNILGDNFQELSEPVLEQQVTEPIVQPVEQPVIENVQPVMEQQVLEQPIAQPIVDNSLSEGDSEIENAYNTEVEQVNETFGFNNSNSTIGDTVIDNSKENKLEEISSAPLEVPENVESEKKGKLGIVIFMILLVLALGFLAFYLYNYVF